MEFQQDHCYMSLVSQMRLRFHVRERTVSELVQTHDVIGINARKEKLLQAFRKRLIDLDFFVPSPEPVTVKVLEFPSYTIELIRIRGVEGLLIPVHLYLPKNSSELHPAAIVTIGHWLQAKQMEENQRLCANLAMKGIAAITFDPIYQGERCPYSAEEMEQMFGPIEEDMWMVGLHMLAGNLAYLLDKNVGALFVREAVCVLDYLCSRPEIDQTRIAAVGQSGGGTQACYLAALDERIACYVPIQCLSRLSITLDDGIGDCEQSLNAISAEQGVEQCDILWAALPKPMMHCAGRFDFFSIEGVRSIEAEMMGVYRVLDHREDYSMALAECSHSLPQEVRCQVYGWLTEQFFGRRQEQEAPISVLTAGQLRCFEAHMPPQRVSQVYEKQLSAVRSRRPKQKQALFHGLWALVGGTERNYDIELFLDTHNKKVFYLHTAHQRGAFCRLERKKSDKMYIIVAPMDFSLETQDASVLYITPWAMENAYNKNSMGYDIETCLFNTAIVLNEQLVSQRVHQIMAAVNFAASYAGASELIAIGIGAGSVPLLIAACLQSRIGMTVLADCQISFDDLFQAERYLISETNILPGLLALADIPELCNLADAVVLNPRHANNRPYTMQEVQHEMRVRCCWDSSLQQGLQRCLTQPIHQEATKNDICHL